MTRRPPTLFAALLVAVAIAVAALWARSYLVQDGVQITFRSDMVSVYSSAGTIACLWDRGLPPMPNSVHRFTDGKPEPAGGGYWWALVTFDLGGKSWGSRVVALPHWVVIASVAAWPVARFIRRRRRHVGGFPVAGS